MSKSKHTDATAWGGFDDAKLADLKRVVDDIRSSRFKLETLRGVWNRMDNDEIEPLVDSLREVADELADVYRDLEEARDNEDEDN
jgi:hypothetical protein